MDKDSKLISDNAAIIAKGIRDFLDVHDLEGSDFDDTPTRVAKHWDKFFNIERPALRAFPTRNSEMLVIKDFHYWGYCPHHLLPICYTFKVGYIPSERALGLSKIPRLCEYLLRKMPLQEDLPCLVTDELETILKPMGCGCIVEGYHLCMIMRGVKQTKSTFISSSLRGLFLHGSAARQEFLNY